MCNRNYGRCHVVVAREDGCWSRAQGEELLGRVQTGAITEKALLDAGRIGVAVGLAQCCLEPELTLATGCLVGMTLDEADVAMAQGQQVARHLVSCFEVIDADARRVRSESTGGHGDGGYAAFPQLSEDYMRLADRGRQDDADDTPFEQAANGRALARRRTDFTFLQHQLGALASAFVQRAQQEFAQVGRARVAVEKADPGALGAGKAACSGIWGVPEVL